MGFFEKLKLTKAEDFPEKIRFKMRDYIVLLMIPAIFLNSILFKQIFNGDMIWVGFADTVFRAILFLIILWLYHKMFVEHWKKFNLAKFQSWTLVIIGGIVLQIVIMLVKMILPEGSSSVGIEGERGIDKDSVNFLFLIMSLGPVFTSLIEDTVFKYTLLQKLFVPGNLWRAILLIINPVIFGLIHYYNFQGNLWGTVSFMAAGFFLNLIYLWTRNIWHTLLIHAVNNFILAFLGTLILLIVKMMTA